MGLCSTVQLHYEVSWPLTLTLFKMMKPLFDNDNPPPTQKSAPARKTQDTFTPMTFDAITPPAVPAQKPARPLNISDDFFIPHTPVGSFNNKQPKHTDAITPQSASTRIGEMCHAIDGTLTEVEVKRITRIVSEICASKAGSEFINDVVGLITTETERVFQHVMTHNSTSRTNVLVEFTNMVSQFSAYQKPLTISTFFDTITSKVRGSQQPTFASMLVSLRSSLTDVKNIESRCAAELSSIKRDQTAIANSVDTCRNYLKYIKQYAIAGKVATKVKPRDEVDRAVEKLEGAYAVSLTTAIAQLELLNKNNGILFDKIQDIIQIKIPQWKQNATTILIVAEQKKLSGLDSEIAGNFEALLKLM